MELPVAFVERTRELLSDEYTAFEQALSQDSPVSIRLNRSKITKWNPPYPSVPWTSSGYYLPARLTFTFDPLFHAGAYYVQEASSMFLEQVIRRYIPNPVRYLDLCAAPGGKTTHAISQLPSGSLIVSNEVLRSRAGVLAENVIKWGGSHCVVTQNEPVDFSLFKHYFDVILTDVPCSGEGMFRKDPGAVGEWSVSNVAMCAQRQEEIIRSVWQALRPGGLLIYSTCTYNREENEAQIAAICREYGAEVLAVPIDSQWGIKGAWNNTFPIYRFMPHVTQGEGFFMAVLRKPEDEFSAQEETLSMLSKKLKRKSIPRKESGVSFPKEISTWIRDTEDFDFERRDDACYALPRSYAEEIRLLFAHLRVQHAGIPLAQLKGKEWQPAQALAMSTKLNTENFPTLEVDRRTALSYLRRESLTLPREYARGYLLLTYRSIPLGWVKNVGNRANNLYPQEWRIRSGYQPDEIRELAADFSDLDFLEK